MKKILFSFLLLSGCLSEKKLAQKCLDTFPPDTTEVLVIDTLLSIDTIKTTEFIKGGSDTFYIDRNKIVQKTIYRNIKPTIELTMLNSRRILDSSKYAVALSMHNIDLQEKQKQIDKLKDSLNDVRKYRYYFYISILLMIIFALVTFKWFTLR